MDPTRFVLDNAGGWALNELNYINNHGKTDLHDVHSYPSFPVDFPGETVEQRYPPTARDLFLGIRSNGKPVLVTEFGPSSYMFNVEKIKEKWSGKEPWWFKSRPKKTAMPAQWDHVGFEERYHRWGFNEIYGDFTKFVESSDWYHFDALKYQTELMRMNPELSGFVCWLFDSAPHAVGSVDFFKDKKVYADELARSWQQDAVLFDVGRKNYWSGESLRADLHVSHFSRGNLRRARVEWWLEGHDIGGEVQDVSMEAGAIQHAGRISFRMPNVGEAQATKLHARLLNQTETLSENFTPVHIYPPAYRQPQLRRVNFVGVYSSSRFQVLGFEVPKPTPRPGRPQLGFDPSVPIAVAPNLEDQNLVRYLQDGATVILMICDDPNYWGRRPSPQPHPVVKQLEQNGLALGGRFQGGHSDSYFIRRSAKGLFARIPFQNPISWPFHTVWPRHSILGLEPENRADMLAGTHGNLLRSVPMDTSGQQRWSEVNGTLAQFRCGQGRLIVSTFELLAPCLDDPVATIMLNDLIWYAGTSFQPKTEFIV